MSPPPSTSPPDPRVGLCTICRHAKRLVSAKGSTFWLCLRAREDTRYRKYPPLPVVSCPGHESGTPESP